MKNIYLVVVAILLGNTSCLPFDKSKQGANPLKNGGYCFWYDDEKNEHYCAYDKTFPPKEELQYVKCDDVKDREKICPNY